MHSSSIVIRHLQKCDVAELYALHCGIVTALSNPQTYRAGTQEFFEKHMCEEGVTIGAFSEKRLVAYALLRFPYEAEDNLGRDLGFNHQERQTIVHLEECGVGPTYRGKGLQSELTHRRLMIASALGYRHACVTISPDNLPSLSSHFRHGLTVRLLTKKYGGFNRFVLHKRLSAESRNECEQLPITIALARLEEIGVHLASGYRGVRLSNGSDMGTSLILMRVPEDQYLFRADPQDCLPVSDNI